jgi:hypothetical protein
MEWNLAEPVPGDTTIAMNGSVDMRGLVTFGHDAPAESTDQHSDAVGDFGLVRRAAAQRCRAAPFAKSSAVIPLTRQNRDDSCLLQHNRESD